MQSIYIGMGLTQAPVEFRDHFQKALKDALRDSGKFEVLDFIGLTAGDDVLVYHEDRRKAETADVCLFVADYPSIGLGMEIAFRLGTGKPMRVCAHKDARITRMLTGMCADHGIPLLRYDIATDIVHALTNDPAFKV